MERKISWFLIIFIGIILLLLNQFKCDPIVQIDDSYIHGQTIQYRNYQVNQFLSVPYAEPPLGELRFQKPVPIDCYPKNLMAVNMPPACEQYTKHPYPWYNSSTYKSEDCLYLNIWTPSDATAKNPKAVMYWIHGGGFRYDSIQNDVYTGTVLAAEGDIIVVTVNYRLGLFGFFTTGTKDAPGNIGLWDILEGLKWVNEYIGCFGGDKSRITIAGESAGSIAVGSLAVSPLADGLFSRQIMQSCAPTQLTSEDNTQNLALSQRLAEMAGCASDCFTIEEHPQSVTECLQKIDAKVLSKYDFYLKPVALEDFVPQFGDEIVPMNPRKAIFQDKFKCTELLIGNNKEEAALLLTTTDPQLFGFFGEKNPKVNKTTGKEMIRNIFKDFLDYESVVQRYLPDDVPENAYDFVRYQVATAAGDLLVVCPDVYHAEQCAEKGGQVYSYYWNHRPSNSPWAPWMGVVHFTEVQFIFGRPLLHPADYRPNELRISLRMVKIWSNFVKDGKPKDQHWPLYSKQNPTFKYLGGKYKGLQYDQGPQKENCEFFRPFFAA